MVSDLKIALRQLAKTPGFALIVILTLSLCIGANSAIFSVVRTVLLKPYPWPGSERLVYIYNTYPLMGLTNAGVSIPDYLDRRGGVTELAESAMFTGASLNLATEGKPQMIIGLRATPSLFSTLQSTAALGRTFNEEDAKSDAAATIVLSHTLWKNEFGSDPSAIGRIIRIDDRPVTVIGVMREGFYFPDPKVQAWLPFSITSAQSSDAERGVEYSQMIGRLKSSATLAGVQRELDQIQFHNAERMPGQGDFWKTSGFDGHVAGFLEENVANVRGMLWLIQAGVAVALLIGCSNIAGLLLARTVGREKEIAIRIALGASRAQVIRLLLAESFVLFIAGGLVGFLMAVWSVDALKLVGLSTIPRAFDVKLDPVIFVFTLVCATGTGLFFGAFPAWSASRYNASTSLKEAGARGSAGPRTQKLRAALVVVEVALAVMLVSTACLLVKSFLLLQEVDPGFSPRGMITAMVALPEVKYDKPSKILAFHDAVIARLGVTPGLRSAGATNALPFTLTAGNSASYSSPDIVLPTGAPQPHAMIRSADPGFLTTFGLTLLQGRWFGETDTPNSNPVVVIDRRLSDRYWKGQNPIGKRIVRYQPGSPAQITCTVIGTVANVKSQTLEENSEKETIYCPISQRPQGSATLIFVARTEGDPSSLAASVREAVYSADPTQPVFDVRTMTERMDEAAQPRRAPMILLAIFGGIAVVLAMLGIYGVLAYSVAQRTTEFGVRIALGSTSGGIAALVLKTGMVLIGIGVVLGLAGYLALNRLVATLLFGTASTDPAILIAACTALAFVALGACLLPALRAARIEPLVALRQD